MLAVVAQSTTWTVRLQQWEYALSNFRPDVFYVDGDVSRWSRHVSPSPVPDLGELPGELVLFAPRSGRNIAGEESLLDLQHAETATWWFGDDHSNVEPERFESRRPDRLVYIPTDSNDQMYSWVAFAVAAWDRRMKRGNR